MFTVEMPTGTITKQVAQLGWKWSTHLQLLGTDPCEVAHFGFIGEGSIIVLQDGVEMVYGAGDAFVMPPGHNAWVNGNQNVVEYEIAKPNVHTH